ncbi:hypothetical protein SDC9_74892 [bioreactor metagenome]|uniref:Uncharacterized protein n=1 Tax=bioreactor metagenome TaxID=1076179 RepID=A0A644YJ15_9ZZZZ
MVNFIDQSCRQSDLVAVGAVSGTGSLGQLLLRQLTGKRFIGRRMGVSGACHPHGLIDIGTARQRISDGPAKAGRGPSEGFDFSRVVMGLVFEHDKVVACPVRELRFNLDGAGIDFLRLVEEIELAGLFQSFGTHGRDIHEGDGLVPFYGKVGFKGVSDGLVFYFNFSQLSVECRVSAMVRPVGVNDFQLGLGGVASFY